MRGKKLLLPESIKLYDFGKLARKESNARTKLRLIALYHLKKGKSLKEIAAALTVTSKTVSNWLKSFKVAGLEGLVDKPHLGRNGYLQGINQEQLRMEIENLQAIRNGGRIRGNDIIEYLSGKYNVAYHKNSIYKVLKHLGMVWITARSKHPNSDIKQQEAFKKTLKKMY